MNKKLLVILAALLVANVHLVSQDKRIYGNAYDWEKLDQTAKWFVVYGLYKSILADNTLYYNQVYNQAPVVRYQGQKVYYLWSKKLTPQQAFNVEVGQVSYFRLMEGIDELYKDYANKNIPIFAIGKLASKRITGKIKTEDIEKELQRLRAIEWK